MQNKVFKTLTISYIVFDTLVALLFIVGLILLLLHKMVFSKLVLILFGVAVAINIVYIIYLISAIILDKRARKKYNEQNK